MDSGISPTLSSPEDGCTHLIDDIVAGTCRNPDSGHLARARCEFTVPSPSPEGREAALVGALNHARDAANILNFSGEMEAEPACVRQGGGAGFAYVEQRLLAAARRRA